MIRTLGRAAVCLALAGWLLAGCQVFGDTPNPYAGLPSNACGGFHLKVVNQTGGAVRVEINGSWNRAVAAGATETVNEGFSQPQPPPRPWQVVITDVSSGRQLFAATMPGPVDQKVTLTPGGPVQTPYALSEDC